MGSSRIVMLPIVKCGYEYMLKVIAKLDIHTKLMEFKMLTMLNEKLIIITPKYNSCENKSTYSNEKKYIFMCRLMKQGLYVCGHRVPSDHGVNFMTPLDGYFVYGFFFG